MRSINKRIAVQVSPGIILNTLLEKLKRVGDMAQVVELPLSVRP
jgi:hypothetical protein